MELCHRGPTPVPVSVVDLEDLESGLEYEGVGDHRIVRLIRELFDVQILLDDPIGVRQERPRGAQRVPELIDVQLIVGRDEGQSRVSISELGIYADQLPYELMLFGIEAATGQMEHHRVASLELRQGPPPAGLIGELVVGKRLAFTDVAAHALPQIDVQLLNGRFDVVVDADGSQQAVRTSLIDANPGLGCQFMTAPSNTVEFQGATHAVVGHGAVLKFETTTCLEALGEIRTQLTVCHGAESADRLTRGRTRLGRTRSGWSRHLRRLAQLDIGPQRHSTAYLSARAGGA